MDGLQGNYYVAPSQQTEFTSRSIKSNAATVPQTQVEDGDKKLRNALIGLGVAAVAGVAIYKTGAIGKLKNLVTKGGNKAANKATNKGAQAAGNKASNLQEVIGRAKTQGLDVVTLADGRTLKVSELQSIQDTTQKVTLLTKEKKLYEKAIANAKNGKVVINGRTMKASTAQGRMSNIQGELNKAQATINKLTKKNNVDSKLIEQASESLVKSGSNLKAKADKAVNKALKKNPKLKTDDINKIRTNIYAQAFVDYKKKANVNIKITDVDTKGSEYQKWLNKRLAN